MFKNWFQRVMKNAFLQKEERLEDWATVLTARSLTSEELQSLEGWERGKLIALVQRIDEHTLEENLILLQQVVLDKLEQPPERLLRAKEFEVVSEMCDLVKQLRWQQFIPQVVELLGRQEEALQIAAVQTLQEFEADITIELLLEKLKNPRKYNVTRIAQVLKAFKVDVGARLTGVFHNSEALVQAVIINLLSELNSKSKEELVRQGLQASDKLVVKRSLEAAATGLPYEEAVEVYNQFLKETDPQLRIKAYEGIASVMEDKGLGLLKRGLLDADWLVRNYCAGRIDLLLPLPNEVWSLVKTKAMSPDQKQALERFVAQPIVHIRYEN